MAIGDRSRWAWVVAGLRRRLRGNELWFLALALAIGVCSGALAWLLGLAAHGAQRLVFGLPGDGRLSEVEALAPARLLMLPLGGAVVGIASAFLGRWSSKPVDVIEANALHGGRVPMRDSLVVTCETLLSNGAGASVGLEAAYAQIGGGTASVIGQWARLRRNDLRTLVGAGAGAAIGAAFGAPLTGTFYAFEVVMGAYTPASIAPVAAASLAAVATATMLGVTPYIIVAPDHRAFEDPHALLYIGLGVICAVAGIGVIRLVTLMESLVRRSGIPERARPVVGGLLLMPLAWATPQVLSAGHGALRMEITGHETLLALAMVLALKTLASAVSLGFRYRGGLFFAALFLGALLGKIYALALAAAFGAEMVPIVDSAFVGMATLSVAIVGGPMTMSLLVLEATHDFELTAGVISTVLIANILVRKFFGYSFSTWRLHLRGETIMSGRDIGWIRNLTANELMRRDPATASASVSIAGFRLLYPLGSTSRVILVDKSERYAGIVPTAEAYASEIDTTGPVSDLATLKDSVVEPRWHIGQVMRAFDDCEADDLAVVDAAGTPIGLLTEKYVRRRYAEELERSQRELFGES